MDALIILFITGLVGLFVGMQKKPHLNLWLTLLGLMIAFFLQLNHGFYTSPFVNYQVLEFKITALYFSLLAIAFSFLIVLGGYRYFKRDPNHTGDYYGLLLFSLCGAIILIGFTDLFMFFLGLEILSIPIYQKTRCFICGSINQVFFYWRFCNGNFVIWNCFTLRCNRIIQSK